MGAVDDTPCSDDRGHCDCWPEGYPCCNCDRVAGTSDEDRERIRRMIEPTVIPLDGRTYRSGESFTIEYTTTITDD